MNIERVSIPGGWISWDPDAPIVYQDKSRTRAVLQFQFCFDGVTGKKPETAEFSANGLVYAEQYAPNEFRAQILESMGDEFLDQGVQSITDTKQLTQNQLTLPTDKQPLMPWLARHFIGDTCNYVFDPREQLFFVSVTNAMVNIITDHTGFLQGLAGEIAEYLQRTPDAAQPIAA